MPSPRDFYDLVSGRRRGPAATVLRGLLRLTEVPYAWAMRRRNRDFDTGRRATQRVSVPVISIGNLTLGGTGKTPMVRWLARWFAACNIRVALLSRGYKASTGSRNDEARELEQTLPGVPHLQNPDRVASAWRAIAEFNAQLILLDDGFQHRRIARDLDIVLIDASEPVGFGHVFPRGTLREPLEGLKRAAVAVLTRADMVDDAERTRIRGIIQRYNPGIVWAECCHAPCGLLSNHGDQTSLDTLKGQRVAAFCGIGNPSAFRRTLESCGCEIVAWREFPDHHHFSNAEIEELTRDAAAQHATIALCTHKDLVKISLDALGAIPLRALQIDMQFLAGQQLLETRLESIAARCAEKKG